MNRGHKRLQYVRVEVFSFCFSGAIEAFQQKEVQEANSLFHTAFVDILPSYFTLPEPLLTMMANPDLPPQLGSMLWEVLIARSLEKRPVILQSALELMLFPDLDVGDKDVNALKCCLHRGLSWPCTNTDMMDVGF